ncbi:MAG: Flp family type IVb pilin [Anaerolineae bacterium]|nr:Flp family type IVb pilin [Anaerolineae bacterium]
MNKLQNFWQDEQGATSGEYVLLLAVVVVGLGAAAFGLGQTISDAFENAANIVETGK